MPTGQLANWREKESDIQQALIDTPRGDGWPQRRLLLLDCERAAGLPAAANLIAQCKPERAVWMSQAPIPEAISAVMSALASELSHRAKAGESTGASNTALRSMIDAIPPSKIQRLLGGECDLLIVDLWSGLDADALGAAVGSLRGGGSLLLLAPPLADWPRWVDPEAARLAPHPDSAAKVGRRFISRLARLLQTFAEAERPDRSFDPSNACRDNRINRSAAQPATPDQTEAVAAICALAAGRARRPLVLTADRGRGKSAALGIAAGRLIASRHSRIIVTAPRRSAIQTLFTHARASLRATAGSATGAVTGVLTGGTAETATETLTEALLRFQAPDQLLATLPHTDLLFIDEAAGIPAPLLEQLLMHYPRVCFATTVHGYEGSGRGFDIRFRALLDQRTPGWRALRLNTPIRWRQGDRLEQWINQLLLLDAEPASDAEVVAADLAAVRFRLHERDQLATNEPFLRQLFGLLVLGHYQTRPNDLRHLLDGPNLQVATLSVGAVVLATALIAREGRLEPALIQPIFEGRRRPPGHLLPQTLSAHAGLPEAPRLGFARILRIAVHPAVRRRGLGQRLIESLAEQAGADGLDLIGASFGASAELLAFWRRCGLAPLHLGSHRNAASGARAAVVLQALSPDGADLIEQARERLGSDLPVLLTGPLQDAEPALIAALLQQACPRSPGPPAAADQRQIDAFANAHASLEVALPALERLVRDRLAVSTDSGIKCRLSRRQRDLLILSILQRRRVEAVVRALQLSGRAEHLRQLREAVTALRSIGNQDQVDHNNRSPQAHDPDQAAIEERPGTPSVSGT
ncbi:MAG: GNAT family N-acetyltransferase [Lamprobacter sp.]|uniref:tRNA(Met) cytidine acetyltransferase TmcA n=1 Tax=Lamprobacter sp. TaxID=3100796 RepID=UPI002B2618A7|nr:GNAT family N-acetyltransferase [Lamprobacter sp.]MEA3639151.1 GNAT family N-acetyltransferase [Lamprobacter sp.]